jgi:peptide/nickel transport system substrate-binding protein
MDERTEPMSMAMASRCCGRLWALGFVVLVLSLPARGALSGGFEYSEDELAYTLNPLHESSMAETRLNELLFESLWGPGYEGTAEPRLADAYEMSDDEMGITIFLRENLKWSDGEPITAEDVVFTIQAYQNPRSQSPDRSRLAFIKAASATGLYSLRVEFNEPEPNPLEKFYFKVLPGHRFDGTGVEPTHPFWSDPTTSGPYRIVSRELGSWTLERNPNALRPPKFDQVKVREMPDKNQQVSSLGYGYTQAVINVPAQYLPEVERSRTADLIPYQNKSWWYLGMNHKHPQLKKEGLRNALARALDLDEALALIGEGYRISGPFVPSSKFYNHSASLRVLDSDTAEAAARMEAVGFVLIDGVWNWKGKPVTLRLFYRSGLGDQGQTVALNLQSQLRRFGIEVSAPVAMDKAVWKERVFAERDFDLVLDSWSFDKNENIYDLFHSKGTQNFVSYSNKDVDSLLARAIRETDPAVKVSYLREVHRLLAQDLPYVFCWTLRSYTALRREVESVFVQPFYYFSQFPDWRSAAQP